MSDYTVRVELHDADDGDYENLHHAMEKAGFIRWIEGGGEKKYRLPTAEYNLMGSALTTGQVRDKAQAIAVSVKPKPDPWVLVTQSINRSWFLREF